MKISYDFLWQLRNFLCKFHNNKKKTSRVGGILRVGRVTPIQPFFFLPNDQNVCLACWAISALCLAAICWHWGETCGKCNGIHWSMLTLGGKIYIFHAARWWRYASWIQCILQLPWESCGVVKGFSMTDLQNIMAVFKRNKGRYSQRWLS